MRNRLDTKDLLADIRRCRFCETATKPMQRPANPVFQFGQSARILIAGQAPGNLADQTSTPFNDPSGVRLREWLGVSPDAFYDPEKFAILPMGFCFPGYTSKGADLPPRKECAGLWRDQLLSHLPDLKVRILIGGYAQSWHLGKEFPGHVTRTVENWRQYAPDCFPVPHPSWRNNAWLKKHSWFEAELLPALRESVSQALSG